ncbi:MAG TPA: tetratricopeptide repeat protein [Chthoniobacterales bacterium]
MQNTADLWEVLCRDFQTQRSQLTQAQHLEAAAQFLASARQVLPAGSLRLSDAYEMAGDLCHAARGDDRAIPYYLEALRLSSGSGVIESSARVAGKLAILREEADQLSDAVAMFEQAIALFKQAGDHRQLAALLSHCAALERRLGDQAKARRHYEEAIRVAVELHGESHAEVAVFLNNFGVALCEWRLFAEAEICHLRALQICESAYGSTHPDVGQSLGNLAVLYHIQRDLPRATKFYQAAIQVLSRSRDPNDPDLQMLKAGFDQLGKSTRRIQ